MPDRKGEGSMANVMWIGARTVIRQDAKTEMVSPIGSDALTKTVTDKGLDVCMSILTGRRVRGPKPAPELSANVFLTELGNPDVPLFPERKEICYRERTNGTAGTGGGKKRMPFCNGTDRYHVSARKGADVPLVIIGRIV